METAVATVPIVPQVWRPPVRSAPTISAAGSVRGDRATRTPGRKRAHATLSATMTASATARPARGTRT